MKCPQCQGENRDGARFCRECGATFGAVCPSCGVKAEAGSKFCDGCGASLSAKAAAAAPLPALGPSRFASPESYTPKHLAEKILTSRSALEGERKHVTVLFADLKGSMELLADRDPEEARKILDPVLERMMEAVHRYAGTVNQVMGDGIMALFGAPLAGRLVPFSKPIVAEGQLINGKPGEQVVETSQEPKLQGDVLHFRIWAGNFFVIIPLRILWFQNTIGPAWRCVKMTALGRRPICEVKVEAERLPADEDMTFVRLHAEAAEGMGVARHVVVKRNSTVDFLAAEGEIVWKENADSVGLGVSDDVWLKVRIDGKEGSIHTQEDFQAIGLSQAG